MRTMKQGYLVMAFGPERYFQMAANLAASIRIMDPTRRVCLVSDRHAPGDYARHFDDFAALPPDDRYPHLMAKLRVFDMTPYEQTMFVDADCLMVKADADDIWKRAMLKPFSITGAKRSTGTWKGLDIPTLLVATSAPYLIQMNSGVFYFDNSPGAQRFFAVVNDLYQTQSAVFEGADLWGGSGQSDEPYFGVAMGLLGMNTDNMANNGRNSWSVSSWRTFYCTSGGTVLKAKGFMFNRSYLPTGVDVLSATFLHFVGLKPRRLYDRLARRVMSHNVNVAALGKESQI